MSASPPAADLSLARPIAVAIVLFMGLPALILLAALAGPIGWIVAAVVLPILVLAVLLWLGWFRRQEDDGPYGGSYDSSDTMPR
jgi:membrane protein implicated in regulation of membrane protease activity